MATPKFTYNVVNTTPTKIYHGGDAPFDMDESAVGKKLLVEGKERVIAEVFQPGKKGEFVQVIFEVEDATKDEEGET